MHLIACFLMIFLVFTATGSQAAERREGYSEEFLQMRDQISLNQKIFEEAMMKCMEKIYSRPESDFLTGTSDLDKCISDKGIQMTRSRERGHQKKAVPGGASVEEDITYVVPDIDLALKKLEMNSPKVPVEQAPIQAAVPTELPASPAAPQAQNTLAENPGQERQKSGKGSSSESKIYLPSKESGAKAKPIFLNR